MQGSAIGADFFEIWGDANSVPQLTSTPKPEPNERPFTIMPTSGHLFRIIDVYPPQMGGRRTIVHRTRTLDYAVVIEGEVILILEDSEVTVKQEDVVVQRGTNHAWENRTGEMARMAFFHVDAQVSGELLDTLPKPLELMT